LYPVVQKALKQLDDHNITSSGLQQTLIADPASIMRVLKLANSAYFSARGQVKTVAAAITLIGFERLRSLLRCVLVSGLFEMLSTRRPAAMKIRARALATAGMSHQIARGFDNVDAEEWLVAGLLHNIGELTLSWVSPEMYASSLKLSDSLPRREAQDLIFGVDSHRVGCWVLDNWCFRRGSLAEHFRAARNRISCRSTRERSRQRSGRCRESLARLVHAAGTVCQRRLQ
jgi:HD-like signal output (HDOD) protein